MMNILFVIPQFMHLVLLLSAVGYIAIHWSRWPKPSLMAMSGIVIQLFGQILTAVVYFILPRFTTTQNTQWVYGVIGIAGSMIFIVSTILILGAIYAGRVESVRPQAESREGAQNRTRHSQNPYEPIS